MNPNLSFKKKLEDFNASGNEFDARFDLFMKNANDFLRNQEQMHYSPEALNLMNQLIEIHKENTELQTQVKNAQEGLTLEDQVELSRRMAEEEFLENSQSDKEYPSANFLSLIEYVVDLSEKNAELQAQFEKAQKSFTPEDQVEFSRRMAEEEPLENNQSEELFPIANFLNFLKNIDGINDENVKLQKQFEDMQKFLTPEGQEKLSKSIAEAQYLEDKRSDETYPSANLFDLIKKIIDISEENTKLQIQFEKAQKSFTPEDQAEFSRRMAEEEPLENSQSEEHRSINQSNYTLFSHSKPHDESKVVIRKPYL